jgi:hypothetical protein
MGMFYAVNPKGKVRLDIGIATRAIMAQLPKDMKNETVLTYWGRKLMKATTILAWFYMPSTPEKAGATIDAAYERYYAMAAPNFDWQKETKKPTKILRPNYPCLVEYLAGMLEPAYYHLHDTYLRSTAYKRGCQIIIALRRYKNKHGRWPENLDDVKERIPAESFVDPINGGSFVYRLTADNFTFYSKGKNNIDENGQYNSTWDPNTRQHIVKQDDFLIWPRKP